METLLLGLGIGLAAGVSPGPLLVLVVTATLRGGLRHGAAVAIAPLLSDAIVVGSVLAALGHIPDAWLSALGVVGGVAVILVGAGTVREGRTASIASAGSTGPAGSAARPETLRASVGRGALVNVLSPHPWITWITVLGPLTVTAWRSSVISAAALVVGFYVTLVGSKLVVAALVSGGRSRLTDAGYARAVMSAGGLLVAFGLLMAVEFGTALVRGG